MSISEKPILDTDVISALRRLDRSPQVVAFLAPTRGSLFLSVITRGEIKRGIIRHKVRNPADLRAWANRTQALLGDRFLPFGPPEVRI